MGGVFYQYGTATHLALLTVAPLFLLGLCGSSMHAMVLLFLSLFAAMWVVMNPSPREGEWPRDARHRIGWEIARDPFLILAIIALVLSAVRAINGGIAIDYEPASGLWQLKGPFASLLPGSVSGQGIVPLAGMLGLAVVTLGVRHALGSRARFGYLLITSVLAAAVVIGRYAAAPFPTDCALLSPWTLLGVYFLFAMFSWVESWSHDSALLELVAAIAAAILLAGILAFAPPYIALVFSALGIVCVAAGVATTVLQRSPKAWFRTVLALAIVLMPVGCLASGLFARPPVWPIFADGFSAVRASAISIAVKAWKGSSQLGVGLGAYPLALTFFASPEDWQILPASLTAVPCGWMHFLVERGILGAVTLLTGLAILLRDLILRYVRSGSRWTFAARHFFGLAVVVGVGATLYADSTFSQIEALIPVAAALALTAAAFPDLKEVENG